ncbi:MAG: TIM barrel protein, partial [Spirochaetaceae bacterium]|nr:TIM barrel protein [Spirochaetaceae bacterium]
MIRIGLSSSALLTRSVDEVIDFAVEAGFDAIEWAGGAHLPAGDRAAAGNVLMSTLRAGLSVASFAPLYKIEPGHRSGIDTLIEEASWLQAPVIRVYAGSRTAGGSCEERERLVAELRRLGDLSGRHGVTVCLSLGRKTCLDGYGSAGRLVEEVAHP